LFAGYCFAVREIFDQRDGRLAALANVVRAVFCQRVGYDPVEEAPVNEREVGAELGRFRRCLEKAGLLGMGEPFENILADPRERRRKAERCGDGAIVVIFYALADRVRQHGVTVDGAANEAAGEFPGAIGLAVPATDDGIGSDMGVDLGVQAGHHVGVILVCKISHALVLLAGLKT
jgi:hypothetical protein